MWTTRHSTGTSRTARRRLAVVVLLVVLPGAAPAAADTGLDDILAGYNANILRTMAAIETLHVTQEMVEPTEDGEEKRALATLSYRKGEGMVRTEASSNLGHPIGEYDLSSLVGPEILSSEYELQLGGIEEMEGRECYRVSVTATERDTKHFDGTVWIDVDGTELVRITGTVADPPFPVQKITLDKAFETTPEGFRLLSRHTGSVDIRFTFITRHGKMHIFYTDYSISGGETPTPTDRAPSETK